MKFLKVSMKVPSSRFVYTPETGIPEEVTTQVYTSQPVQGLVSFDPDGISNPQYAPMYGHGLNGWYIAEEDV